MKKICGRQYRTLFQVMVLIYIIGVFANCDDDSPFYDTEDISVDMEVTSHSNHRTDVKVYLKNGSDNLDVVGRDRLEATADGETRELHEKDGYYHTTFSNLRGGTEVEIALIRAGWDDAKNSRVTLPRRFVITDPDRNTIVSADTPIVFNWSPSGTSDNMWLRTTYECQQSSANGGVNTFEGTGPRINISDSRDGVSLTLANLLDVSDPAGVYDRGCDRITVQIIRERFGTIDSEFESGDISALQERQVRLSYQP